MRSAYFAAALFLLIHALAWCALAQEISWIIPHDGGTPRDTNRIQMLGPREFTIRASFEDGGQSVLRHAVSRVDLVCRNSGPAPAKVTLHLELSDDAKRTDYDTRPESGMKLRDFVFIQPPGSDWRQIDGSTEGWLATVSFMVPPGETKVGLSPWYTYQDLLGFIQKIPAHPHLRKELIGKSDGDREHWELTISNPDAKGEKRTIFWQAREHAYETWSSYAMEGLIPYLLSDEAAEFRKHFRIVLHPMTNVDGVGSGYEYRGGYDYPKPRGTTTGRLTFETIDRLKPHYAVAWHNWIAPRDRNVVFYTDGEQGVPTPRAWLRFTQLFPSLRSADHRWKDENTPLKYNWEGRSGLSEGNPHQYAMKKHGTRVWGWEMPWWNFKPADARRMGREFGSAFLTTITEIEAGRVPPGRTNELVEVPRWEFHEFVAKGKSTQSNLFTDSTLVGEFVSPSGRTNVVDGFYDGDDTWRLRFAPSEEGDWSYLLRGEGVEILQTGKLRSTPPRGHGPIGVHSGNPYAFAYADGTPFFPMGDTCYALHDDSTITPELRAEYLKTRRAQKFNFVRMSIGHSEYRAATNNAYWAWGGTAKKPDYDRLNPEFFRSLDHLLLDMNSQGMNAELLMLNFYRRPFTDTNVWTSARERLWLRYVTARYSAFNNIFLWTLSNEYETHPDGQYRLDFPEDVDWAKRTARFIKSNDPYHHMVTTHPVISASRKGESPRAAFDPPWRIGEFFGNGDELDVLSQQTGTQGEGTQWDEKLQCWTGDSATLVASIAADRRFRKPVLNSENGYEYLRGFPTEKQQVHHTDKVRRSSWRIACAGGYFAAGFNGTIGHSDIWNRIDPGKHYTFEVKDEGAGAQLGILYNFFSALPFDRLQPFTNVTGNVVALTEPGAIFVLYYPHGGEASLDLGPNRFSTLWLNPRTGERRDGAAATGKTMFRAPDENDWTLLLTNSQP